MTLAVKPLTTIPQVTDAQLTAFAHMVYTRIGVRLSPQKKTLLSTRLRRRLRETGIEDYEAYYNHLLRLPADAPEWDAFLQEITTHESYLFRDEVHWTWFRQKFLPAMLDEARDGKRQRTLRIWSAACSTGDEAATVAACVAATIPNLSQWIVQIVGTDIGLEAVRQARAAQFNVRAMRLVPDDYRRRFFQQVPDQPLWQLKPAVAQMTSFKQHNLMQPLREKPFDLVILKNVLIYFDNDSKRKVMQHLQNVLRPGGLLMCGPAEGISSLVGDMQRVHPWLYRKG